MSTLLAQAERTVPRYTSYPTAPHFSGAVGPADYAGWLAALPSDTRLSLYLHVPFCREMCLYCGCHTKVVRREQPLIDYAGTLLAEMELIAHRLPARGRVARVHWGGGTPSLMPPEPFAQLIERLETRFDLSGIEEHAMEVDPRTVDAALAERLVRAGIDRVSLGVQDFHAHVQEAIGRPQPYSIVADAVAALRAAGIRHISFDLMYGLPMQSTADCARSAAAALTLQPDRIALFGYAHVPWFKTHQRLIREDALPSAEERLAAAEAAAAVLTKGGLVPIGFDHFAKPDDRLAVAERTGGLRRNFQGYTDDDCDALIGLGASAIGRLPHGFVQNLPDFAGYARAIASGTLATKRGLRLTRDDRLRGEVIERLMCDLAVEFGVLSAEHGLPESTLDSALPELETLADEGLLTLTGRLIVMTKDGRPFVRLAAAAFDRYLDGSGARHSKAV